MIEMIVAVFMVVGSFFILIGGIGVIRMPDLFLRMSCSTKAATIGFGSLLMALAFYWTEFGVTTRALATFGFILLSVPVAAHRMGRIAYLVGVPLWDQTLVDELQGVYPPDACKPFGEECIIPDMDAPEVDSTHLEDI
jgi:multicomponent Na+:H+ antiporter subunit G